MTLETIFYTLSIIYLTGGILLMLALIIGVIVVIWKIKHFKQDIENKIKDQIKVENLTGDNMKALYPMLVSSAAAWGVNKVMDRLSKRKR